VAGGGAGSGVEDGVNGFIVKNDAGAFAKAVMTIASDDSLYARLAEGACLTAQASGTHEMCEKVVEVYRTAITEAGGRKREDTEVGD
jgi:glycosyltransferase involved in cell wall biosynthesis